MPKQTDYGLLPYLLYKYTFSYNYSVGLFTMQQKMKTILTNKVVAFAPKYEEIHPDQFKTSDKTVNDILFPLQSSEEEAKNVARIFGGKVISGKRATKINFLKHTSDGSVLHLAMHAIIDNEYPMDSKLVFSQSNNTKNNNFLKTYEIYNINLHSPLIVLSACNTGNGELIKGEGIISLARGFVYAGCPSMVITLWSIADQSSCEFMQLFYKNLKYNVNIDKALQQAKIQYIENSDNIFSNPFYWAGFIQIGKTDSFIYTSKNHHIVLIIVLSLCIILGIILYWFVKEKK
jgi:CHAT domain-containing protein